MEAMTLFDTVTTVDRCCGTCEHAVARHGRHTKGTYPLVCLLVACPVRYRQDDGYPCRDGFDGNGVYPKGWTPR